VAASRHPRKKKGAASLPPQTSFQRSDKINAACLRRVQQHRPGADGIKASIFYSLLLCSHIFDIGMAQNADGNEYHPAAEAKK
jgi:hypothetical protein